MAAPLCVAKGADDVALRIRALAKEHDVPIVENPPLARALFAAVEIDETIPDRAFQGRGAGHRLRHADEGQARPGMALSDFRGAVAACALPGDSGHLLELERRVIRPRSRADVGNVQHAG